MQEQEQRPKSGLEPDHPMVLEMNAARDAKRAVLQKIQSTEKAMQAAQAEAEDAKAQWRKLLRDSDGTLTKEIQKLRAAERSAYELKEEYEAILAEVRQVLVGKELALVDVADRYISAESKSRTAAAEAALSSIVEQHGGELRRAMALHLDALIAREFKLQEKFKTFAPWADSKAEDVHQVFMQELLQRVLQLPTDTASAVRRIDLREVDMELLKSPAKRTMLKARANPKQ